MPLVIPVQATPSQEVNAVLNSQQTTLRIYQKSTGMFMDVLLDGALVIGGVICLNDNVIIRSAYLGYLGDFAILDTQGSDDPYFTGLGTRWIVTYWFPDELAPTGLS